MHRLSVKTRSFATCLANPRGLAVKRSKGAVFANDICERSVKRAIRRTHERLFVRGAIPPTRRGMSCASAITTAFRAGNFHDSAQRKRAPLQEDPRNCKVCSLALLRALRARGSTRGWNYRRPKRGWAIVGGASATLGKCANRRLQRGQGEWPIMLVASIYAALHAGTVRAFDFTRDAERFLLERRKGKGRKLSSNNDRSFVSHRTECN